jgi:hypothetical protein
MLIYHLADSFSTSALDRGEWSASRPSRALPPGKVPPGTYCTGGWVGLTAGLDTEDRGKILSPLPGIEPLSPGRPAGSQTLYWLSYPAHRHDLHHICILRVKELPGCSKYKLPVFMGVVQNLCTRFTASLYFHGHYVHKCKSLDWCSFFTFGSAYTIFWCIYVGYLGCCVSKRPVLCAHT